MIAKTPSAPYYVVIFTSLRTTEDTGYEEMADRMVELARQQPGYLGIESFRNPDRYGVTISYWSSLEAIHHWKRNLEHREAQHRGREEWYSRYMLRVCRVEYDYGMGLDQIEAEI